jgi:exosortase
MTAFLVYLNRKKIFEAVRYEILPGVVVMAAGVTLLAFVKMNDWNLDAGDLLALSLAPVLLTWWGAFLVFYGRQAFKAGIFPLLFLILFLPIPSVVMENAIVVLQHASANVSFVLLKLTGMPIYRDGMLFTLPTNLTVEVAPECSGIRSGISLLILSLLAGHLTLRSGPMKIALLLAAIPIMIFKNALRIGTLSFLAVHIDHQILTSRLHREGGIPFFILALLLMYPILRFLIQSERRRVSHRQPVTQEASL